jgi:hypothetical protein
MDLFIWSGLGRFCELGMCSSQQFHGEIREKPATHSTDVCRTWKACSGNVSVWQNPIIWSAAVFWYVDTYQCCRCAENAYASLSTDVSVVLSPPSLEIRMRLAQAHMAHRFPLLIGESLAKCVLGMLE